MEVEYVMVISEVGGNEGIGVVVECESYVVGGVEGV